MKFYRTVSADYTSCSYRLPKKIGAFVPDLRGIFNIQLIFGNMMDLSGMIIHKKYNNLATAVM
jgi:hypothetical protein